MTNYTVGSLSQRRLPPPLPKSEITLDEVAEEVWLTSDKDDARCVLETYHNNLSKYQRKLLDEVLFGCEKEIQYFENKSWNAEKLHQVLDRILP